MNPSHRLVRSVLGVSLLCLLVVGCDGKGKGSLSGTVSYKGKSVVVATVTVYDADKRPYQASVIDGKYSVKGIPEGPVEIIVTSPSPSEGGGGKVADGGRSGRRPNSEEPTESAGPPIKGWVALPAKYADTKTTPLKFTLKPGPNDYDLNLAD